MESGKETFRSIRWIASAIIGACLSATTALGQAEPAAYNVPAESGAPSGAKNFATPQQAAAALIAAADEFNELAFIEIFGPGGYDVVLTGEYPQDRQRAADFVAQAREQQTVAVDRNDPNRALLLVGNQNWPFPVPIVKSAAGWSFDASAGRQELRDRRVGYNELDAIEICRNYVSAQQDFALRRRQGYDVNQYAQRIVSTPGKQDGLAWQNGDGSWGGPLGVEIARAIQQGYTSVAAPYHGYLFKVLKGQGPAAPLGEMDFVVEGVMIGGFALVAAPAEYRITGVKTFIVSHKGVVYQKDLGPGTLEEFKAMERYNPDKSWTPVPADNQ
jgi:hypothetical protein